MSKPDGEQPPSKPLDVNQIGLYFDQVSLPVDLAQACLGDLFQWNARQTKPKEFVKFVKLSTLRQHERLPSYQHLRRDLVDYRQIKDFRLQGGLSWWGGEDVFSDSPCVFVSHRWQSADHPDPHGAQRRELPGRLGAPTRDH